MSSKVTDRERQIVQMMILDRWNPGRINEKIASHFCLTKNHIRHIRRHCVQGGLDHFLETGR
jgi:hypothetical protein